MTDASLPSLADDSPAAELDPVLAGGAAAPDLARIEGIVAQTRSDYRGTDLVEIETRLRQRFEQSGIVVDEQTLAEFARQIADSAT